MKVKDAKKMLEKFDDEQDIVVLNEGRMGHDDAVYGFVIVQGFSNSECYLEDVRLEETNEEGGEVLKYPYKFPCCVISF